MHDVDERSCSVAVDGQRFRRDRTAGRVAQRDEHGLRPLSARPDPQRDAARIGEWHRLDLEMSGAKLVFGDRRHVHRRAVAGGVDAANDGRESHVGGVAARDGDERVRDVFGDRRTGVRHEIDPARRRFAGVKQQHDRRRFLETHLTLETLRIWLGCLRCHIHRHRGGAVSTEECSG